MEDTAVSASLWAGHGLSAAGLRTPCRWLYSVAVFLDHRVRSRARQYLCKVTMPGPTYEDVLGELHRLLEPRTYLEIGVKYGSQLKLAIGSRRVVGVDPSPQLDQELPHHVRIFEEESNTFFAHSAPELELEGEIDLAFIDGLHAFPQVLDDLCNVESLCHPDAVIVCHDVLPVDAATATSTALTPMFWTGDVWKLVPCLQAHRPDLHLAVVPTYPSGLLLIAGLNPESTVLRERRDALLEKFDRLSWRDYRRLRGAFPIIENDFRAISAAVTHPGR